jgi:outer membrane protein OmpA-like peptidoglycan-associated protein
MRSATVVGMVGVLAALGCSRPYPQTKMVSVSQAPNAQTCAADADCGGQQLCVDRLCYNVASAMECANSSIHFPTNSAEIDARNRTELNQLAACLRSDRTVRVVIAGNADERGDASYNRALAQRRADTVSGYLESAGVPSSQLATVSYGVDDPLCERHDATCWRKNRRVDIAATTDKTSKNKLSTDDDTNAGRRIDGTGNGTDNGTPLGK